MLTPLVHTLKKQKFKSELRKTYLLDNTIILFLPNCECECVVLSVPTFKKYLALW